MNFLNQIQNSIYNRDFYKSLLTQPFWYSFKYYLKLSLLLSIVITIVFTIFAVPDLLRGLWKIDTEVLNIYPDDLVVTISEGRASINQTEPYVVPLPRHLIPEEIEEFDNYQNLLVIDTKVGASIEQALESTSTMAFLSETQIAYKDIDGRIYTDSIAPFTNMTISEGELRNVIEHVRPWYKVLAPLSVVLVFGASFLSMILLLGIILIQNVFSWILLRLMGVKINGQNVGFIKSFQVTLHAVTLSFVLISILVIFGAPTIGILLFALTLAILYFNLCPCLDTTVSK